MNYEKYFTSLDSTKKENFINDVVNLTIKDLVSYGNVISDEKYTESLKIIADNIMFYDNNKIINAINFPTGCGKTTIMINSIAYMVNNKELLPYSGTIILRLYKSDCDDTASAINKKVKKNVAYSFHSGDNKNRINNEDLSTYPIVVMTHEGFKTLIKNNDLERLQCWANKKRNRITKEYNKFYRQRLIIDEEIKNVRFFEVNIKTINNLENCIMNLGNNDLYDEFIEFIIKIKREFLKPYQIQKNKMFFITLDNIVVPEKLDEVIYDSKDKIAQESLLSIHNLLEHGGYLRYSDEIEHKSIVTFQYIDINSPLFSQIALDATSGINHLYKINKDYNVINLPIIKNYNNTYINIFNGITGSRKSIGDNLEEGLLDKFVEYIENNIVETDKVLIILNKKDYEAPIKKRFKDYIYLENLIFTYYGLTTGINDYAECNKLFSLGIPLMDDPCTPLLYFLSTIEIDKLKPDNFNSMDTTLIPKKGARRFIEEEFENIRVSQTASVVTQAINRISCRQYIKGDTPLTYIFLINKDKEIDNLISISMPGVNISYDWKLDFEDKKGNIKTRKITPEEKLIHVMQRIIEDEEYRNELIEKKMYSVDKGIKKSKLRELADMGNRVAYNDAMKKPLMEQFIKDYNLTINSTDKCIKLI